MNLTLAMTTTVTEGNQAGIPPEIVRDFDNHLGTRLRWAKTGDGAILVHRGPHFAAIPASTLKQEILPPK